MSDFTNYAEAHSNVVSITETSGKQYPMDILEFLMKSAVNLCEAHSGDILFDLQAIMEAAEHKNSAMYGNGFYWFFGFRDHGEDHLAFIECRYDGTAESQKENYSFIYKLSMEPKEFDYVEWRLESIEF